MRFWQEKERPVEAISFVAISAGLTAVLSLLCAFFPFLTPFLMLIVPLLAVIVALLTKLPYLFLFLVSAFGASLAVAFWNFQSLLFYLLPSLLVGAALGACEKFRIANSYTMFFAALLEVAVFYFASFLCSLFYGVGFLELFSSLFGKAKTEQFAVIFPLFALTYGYAESLLVMLVLRLFFAKYHPVSSKKSLPLWFDYALGALFLALSLGLVWVHTGLGFFLLGCLLYWVSVTSLDSLPYAKKWLYPLLVIALFVFILLFALFYSSLPKDKALILLAIPLGALLLCNLINQALLGKESDNTI